MSRKQAREIALHLVFEMGFNEFEADEILTDRLDESILKSIGGEIELYAGKISEKDSIYIICGTIYNTTIFTNYWIKRYNIYCTHDFS